MAEAAVEFQADDLSEIGVLLADMAHTNHLRYGLRGAKLTRLLWRLADDLCGCWLDGDDGRPPREVKIKDNALAGVDRDILDDTIGRIDKMLGLEGVQDDHPWQFVLGLVRGACLAELGVQDAPES